MGVAPRRGQVVFAPHALQQRGARPAVEHRRGLDRDRRGLAHEALERRHDRRSLLGGGGRRDDRQLRPAVHRPQRTPNQGLAQTTYPITWSTAVVLLVLMTT